MPKFAKGARFGSSGNAQLREVVPEWGNHEVRHSELEFFCGLPGIPCRGRDLCVGGFGEGRGREKEKRPARRGVGRFLVAVSGAYGCFDMRLRSCGSR